MTVSLIGCGGAKPHDLRAELQSAAKACVIGDAGLTGPDGTYYPPGTPVPDGTNLPPDVTQPTGCASNGPVPTPPPFVAPLPPPSSDPINKLNGIEQVTNHMADVFGIFDSNYNEQSRTTRINNAIQKYSLGQVTCHFLPWQAMGSNNMMRYQAMTDQSQNAAKKWLVILFNAMLERDPTQSEAQAWANYGYNFAVNNGATDQAEGLRLAVYGIEQGLQNTSEFKTICQKLGLKY